MYVLNPAAAHNPDAALKHACSVHNGAAAYHYNATDKHACTIHKHAAAYHQFATTHVHAMLWCAINSA